jgi:hypothetical protein
MFRIIFVLALMLGLFSSCQPSRAIPTAAPWEPAENKLTIQTVKPPTQFIAWEAEQPRQTNFPPAQQNPFAPANPTEAAVLSNGQWIGVEGKRSGPLFLEYAVKIPTTGDYFFYSRKFWQHGPFRWRWDDTPWQAVTAKVYLMDSSPIRQFVGANWVSLGKVTLTAGTHTFRIELTELDGAAAFDCFLLTPTPFQARGKLNPNQRYAAQLSDGFIFDPESDPFRKSPIDLRYLNESFAGEQGWIQTKGETFIHSKTQAQERFWAVNMGMPVIQMDKTQMQPTARFLAKQGVNMVRLHGPLWSKDLRTIDPQDLKQLFAFIAALKQEGIYTCISIYFPNWLELKDSPLIAGYGDQKPFATLFFNPDFQKIYQGWWRQILTTPNPDTGIPLTADPAVAMVEIVNEDSYFFWTFDPYKSVPAEQMQLLEGQFGQWLQGKYGSLDKARQAWKADSPTLAAVQGDRPDTAGLLSAGRLVADRKSLRAKDTTQFLAAGQQQFFQTTIAHLRQTLGYRGLIYASNWITADAQILGPVDKYTNTVADFIDRHGYFSNPHQGANASYALSPGDTYQDQSALLFQAPNQPGAFNFDLPIMEIRYNDLPATITEINWTSPNRFRADLPLLAAAYGLLQGNDGYYFFFANHIAWSPSTAKFEIASPTIMGQFPAAALIYRRGLVKPGASVVDVSLKIADILNLEGAPVVAPQNLDELRAKDIPAGQTRPSDPANGIDPLAFLVGQVNVRFAQTEATRRQADLSAYIDRTAQIVRSSTGELRWDYRHGLMQLDAPQAQGVTGFLKQAGPQNLSVLQLKSPLDYGTVLLVALDGLPLATSKQMLLQVMSEEQNFGWKTTGSPQKTIAAVGSAPIVVRNLAGQVTINRPDARSLTVTALDFHGYPRQTIGTANQINLLPNSFYYLIEGGRRKEEV